MIFIHSFIFYYAQDSTKKQTHYKKIGAGND